MEMGLHFVGLMMKDSRRLLIVAHNDINNGGEGGEAGVTLNGENVDALLAPLQLRGLVISFR